MALSPFKISTAMALALSLALPFPAAALDDKQKEEIGAFIKDYLIAHPEIMLDVQDALEKKQQQARLSQANMAVDANHDAIFNAPDDISLGNPKGDVTVVEFFDYNCGYCRHALSDMDALIKKDPNIRFVLKEFPILGPDSVAAHKVSDALRKLAPEKYPAFHHAMLSEKGRATEASAIETAVSLGLNEAEIRKTMADSPDDDSVQQAYALAQSIGITGTPSYIVGNEAVFGAVGAATMGQKIANLRNCGKATC
jgi:protein-disulfide isomerase